MNRYLVLALLAVAVVAVVGVGSFLVTGGGPLGGSGGGAEEDADADGPLGEVGLGPDGDAPVRPRNPVLFGRASVRVGKGDVLGRVADFVTKDPVQGADVRLEGVGYGQETVATRIECGEDGRFHLAAVPAGDGYTLEVVVEEAGVRRVTDLAVSADDVTDLGTIWLGDAGTLIGRVVSVEDGGIAGASIRVLPGGSSMEQMMKDVVGFISKLDRDPEPVAEGKTDANGRFEIEGIPPGPITIVARASGFYQQVRPAVMTKDGVIGDEPVFRMVVAEHITGRVVSDLGRPVAGARIGFMDTRDDENGFYGRRFVETESDGTFRVESPPQAKQFVAIVAAEDYPTLFSEVGDRREGLEFTLVAGASLTLRFVAHDSGEPIPDASIVAMLSVDENLDDEGCLLSGVTDAGGEIVLDAKPGFVVMVFFAHPFHGGGLYSPAQGIGLGGAALVGPDQLKVVAGENRAELRKVPGVPVTGRVTGAEGEPIAGATVEAGGGFAMMGGGKVVTDASGDYRLTVAAMPQMMIAVEAPGYVQDPKTAIVELGASRPVQHDIALLRAGRVEGLVVGPRGAPARGVEVRLQAEATPVEGGMAVYPGTTEASGITDNQGRYVFETVVPDKEYHAVGRGDGYVVSRSDTFEVRAGMATVKAPRLTMQKGVRVEVEVLDPSGGTVKGASVDVHVETADDLHWNQFSRWQAFQSLVTSADGRATAKDVPPGKITFTASRKGFASSRASTDVSRESPPTAPVVVRLRPTMIVAGEVRDQHGEVVEGAHVSIGGVIEAAPGGPSGDENWVPSSSGTTDARGHFDLKGVPAGVKFTIHVHAEGHAGKSFPVEDPTDRLQFQLQKTDPDAQRRMNEIQTEIMAVYQRLQAAKDDTEREALQEQLQALSLEMNRLQQGGVDTAEARAVEDDR